MTLESKANEAIHLSPPNRNIFLYFVVDFFVSESGLPPFSFGWGSPLCFLPNLTSSSVQHAHTIILCHTRSTFYYCGEREERWEASDELGDQLYTSHTLEQLNDILLKPVPNTTLELDAASHISNHDWERLTNKSNSRGTDKQNAKNKGTKFKQTQKASLSLSICSRGFCQAGPLPRSSELRDLSDCIEEMVMECRARRDTLVGIPSEHFL